MSAKLNTTKANFGTLPVFLTSLSTILGAILFLRFGYAMGNLGFLGTMVIIAVGHMVTIPTAMAISEIATNQPSSFRSAVRERARARDADVYHSQEGRRPGYEGALKEEPGSKDETSGNAGAPEKREKDGGGLPSCFRIPFSFGLLHSECRCSLERMAQCCRECENS